MVEMKDVGEKMEETCVPSSDDKGEKYYPSLRLSTKQMPELKGLAPGKKLTLLVDCEVKGFSMRSTKGEKESGNYDIEIRKIGISKKSVKEDEDDEDEMGKLKKNAKQSMNGGRTY